MGAQTAPATTTEATKIGAVLAGKIDAVKTEPVLKDLKSQVVCGLLTTTGKGKNIKYLLDGQPLDGFTQFKEVNVKDENERNVAFQVLGSMAFPPEIKCFIADTYDDLPSNGLVFWRGDNDDDTVTVVAADAPDDSLGGRQAIRFDFRVGSEDLIKVVTARDKEKSKAFINNFREDCQAYREAYS